MAIKRTAYSKLSKSGKYYRDNCKAAKKKASTDKKINARPEQKAKRRELADKNRKTDKAKGKSYRKGKDYDHATGRYVSRKSNRGRTGEGGRKKRK